MEFYGNKLSVKGNDDDDVTHEDNTPTISDYPEPDPIIIMSLDCRNHPDLNIPMVKEYEVCDTVNIDDGGGESDENRMG